MQVTKPLMIVGAIAFLSLSANVLLAGMLLGQKMSGYGGKFMEKQEKFIAHEMDEADQKIVRQSMNENKDRFKKTKKEMDAARQAVHAAMNADPFNQQALDQAMDNECRQKAAFLAMIRETRDKTFQQLSPEGREKMQKFHKSIRSFGGRGEGEGGSRFRRDKEGAEGYFPEKKLPDDRMPPGGMSPDVDQEPPPPLP